MQGEVANLANVGRFQLIRMHRYHYAETLYLTFMATVINVSCLYLTNNILWIVNVCHNTLSSSSFRLGNVNYVNQQVCYSVTEHIRCRYNNKMIFARRNIVYCSDYANVLGHSFITPQPVDDALSSWTRNRPTLKLYSSTSSLSNRRSDKSEPPQLMQTDPA